MSGKIDFDHIIQRSYVWEPSRKTGLIESMIIGYPIPAVYAKRISDGSGKKGSNIYSIMDGKQRLSTIKQFLNDEFALTNNNLEGILVVLKNLYIPYKNTTSEIDLVMVHEKGIYVFESKNYSGWIFGSAGQLYWTQSLKGGEKNKFYNPIRQNTGHMGALLRQLKVRLESARIYSFVVFSDRCTLRNVPASGKFGNNGNGWRVLHLCELRESLEHAFSSRPQVYDSRTLESWWQALQPCVNVPESVRQNHVKFVQKLHTT